MSVCQVAISLLLLGRCLVWRTSENAQNANFAYTEFSEVARQASGSGIMVVVERLKVNYATPWLEKKGEDDA
jgi:hypothetical protein